MWLARLENGGDFEIATTENDRTAGAHVVTAKPWKLNESVLVSQPPGFVQLGGSPIAIGCPAKTSLSESPSRPCFRLAAKPRGFRFARGHQLRQLTRVGCTFNVHEICVLPVCQSPVHDISHWAVG
jgi:hypothetical protein